MSNQERIVVVGIAAVMVLGASLSFVRRQLRRNRPPIELQSAVSDSSVASAFPLDLNRATAEQLEALPGIGPVLSRRIVEYRQAHGGFTRIPDLLRVTGIGPKRLAAIERFVTVKSDSVTATPAQRQQR